MKSKQSGMTLLEVLIAMTLMVIISAISFASLNGLIDAKHHTDSVAKSLRQELLTSQQLNKDIHGLIRRDIKDQFGNRKPAVMGRFSSIEFSRNGHANPLNQHRTDLQRVRWFVRDNTLMRGTLDLLDQGGFTQWQMREYLNDIKELNISFINRSGQESRVWPVENNTLPLEVIRFTLVMKDGTNLKYHLSVVN